MFRRSPLPHDDADRELVPLLLGGDWHEDRPGGLNRYLADLLVALRGDGTQARAAVVGPAEGAPVGTVATSSARHPLPMRLWSYSRAAGRIADDVDVVDAHFALYAWGPVALGRLRRLPLVVHFQGPWADEDFSGGHLHGVRVSGKRLVELSVYRRASAFVTLSGAFKKILVERYGIDPWMVHVIPPGVDLERFRPGDTASARRRLGVATEGSVVVAVRRLVPRMGVDVLLDAWRWLDAQALGATLLVVGDGPERERLQGQAVETGISSSVRFLGRVDEDTLVACYQAADVSVAPSLALEGFGLVVLESLACGTPVIAADVGGLPEALVPLDASLVVPAGDPGALSSRVAAALRPAPALPSRERCRTYAESFSFPEVARRHRAVYRRPEPSERKPRVVFLDHCAQLSGGELALLRLLSAFDEIDAHVILAEDGLLVSRLLQAGISVEVLPLGTSARRVSRKQVRPGALPLGAVVPAAAHVVRLARRLRALAPDLVHTNSLKATVYGGFAGRMAGIPVVWHIRDRIADDYLPAAAVRAIRVLAHHLPAAVIANSTSTLATLGEPKPCWAVVPSPVHMPVNVAVPVPGPEREDGLRVGIVGRLAPWKGQHVFLDAFARAFPSSSAKATVIGDALFGEGDYARRLVTDAESLGIAERTEFRGFREDIGTELGRLDILVHASTIPEPFGSVVVEGMAMGLPVVASAGGGPREIVDDGVTGLLSPPGDAVALARQLRRLADDPYLRQRLGDAARERARDFAPERVVPQVMAVYRHVLGTMPPPPGSADSPTAGLPAS